MTGRLDIAAVPGIKLVEPGDDLAALIVAACAQGGVALASGDVVVVAQKIVSKAEGRRVDLATVTPSPRAVGLGLETGKDARLVEVILSESQRVVRTRPGLLIVQHRLGFVMAHGGVDQSNVASAAEGEFALLLPENPDASADALRARLRALTGAAVGIVINDSTGRAWRHGTVGIALGAAGLPALLDLRGRADLFGRKLEVTVVGFADEIAAAASLVMGQADEARPVVRVRGLDLSAPALPAAAIVRPAAEDLFR
jgi:coenzyme F420-0:L-glutamate ligase/coenzyme F420-1:gamma-L-glutamate ligase